MAMEEQAIAGLAAAGAMAMVELEMRAGNGGI
jgi:hypothetical protein